MLQFSPENNPSVFIVTMRLYKRQLFLYDEHFSRVYLKNWIPHLFQDKCKIWLVAFSPPEQPDNSISCGRSMRRSRRRRGGGRIVWRHPRFIRTLTSTWWLPHNSCYTALVPAPAAWKGFKRRAINTNAKTLTINQGKLTSTVLFFGYGWED